MSTETKVEKTSPYSKEVVLPSKGMFYGDKLPGGKITIRPIKVSEEKLIAGGGNRLQLADKVLQKCIESQCLPVNELLLTDKFYLLLCLRSISYGPEYSFKIKCASCDMEFVHSITLPEGLCLKSATKNDVEPFDVKLPVCGKTVSLRFLRGTDEEEIENYVKQLPSQKSDDGDSSYAFRLSRFISKIDGQDTGVLEKLSFCEELIGMDSLAIRKGVAQHETGPVMTIKAKCPSCRAEIQTDLPFTNEFFPSGNV